MDELKKILCAEEDEVDPGFSNGIMAFIMRLIKQIIGFIVSYIPMPIA